MGQETQPSTESSKYDMDQPFKSIAVVALAGFAGSLAGLSISRSRPTTKNLPQIWSISCATFAGIIECSKIMSPTKLIIDALGVTDSNILDAKDTFFQNIPLKWNSSYTQILGDYTIGGMVAGAIFKGGQIESILSTSSQDRIPSSKMKYDTTTAAHEQQKKVIGKGKILTLAHKHRGGNSAESVLERNPSRFIRSSYTNQIPKAGIMTGLLPGMMLGIIAGSMQILITEAERLLEEHDAWNNDDHAKESYKLTKEQEDEIEEKVQNMSISEIEREIKELKKQLGKE